MKEVPVELVIDDGSVHPRLVGEPPFEPVLERGRRFQFSLCRKEILLGETPIDQWWMRRGSLYGTRGHYAPNGTAIVDAFWAMCMGNLTCLHESVQDAYILARLLPDSRSNGSRRVLLDSVQTKSQRLEATPQQVADELEQLLQQSGDNRLDHAGFRDQTADAIGPPAYDDDVWTQYRTMEAELLSKGRAALERSGAAGFQATLDHWRGLMDKIGRRRGNALEKQVLDILSYECRAAFHQCYSAVWCELIPHLRKHHGMSETAAQFHGFWHLDHRMPANETDEADFHLFHGHIFALHPAGANFMRTRTGPQLLEAYLLDPNSLLAHRRLLHGLAVAVEQFASRSNLYALLRKRQPEMHGGQDLVRLEEEQVERRAGRRRQR